MPDTSLPIIDLTYRLVLEVNRAMGEFPRDQHPGLGRRGEAAAFDLPEALRAALVGGHAASPESASRGTLKRESDSLRSGMAGPPTMTTESHLFLGRDAVPQREVDPVLVRHPQLSPTLRSVT